MNDVVLYLRSDNRALVAIAPPGTALDPALIAGTVQMTVSGQRWQSYLATRDSLPAGQDLQVNDDGSTGGVAHVPRPREQVETLLDAYLNNPTPTLIEMDRVLKGMIRIVRAKLQ